MTNLREYWGLVPRCSVTDTITSICDDFASTSDRRVISAILCNNMYVFSLCVQYGVNINQYECLITAVSHCRVMIVYTILKTLRVTANECKKAVIELVLSNAVCPREMKLSIYSMLAGRITMTKGCLNYIIIESSIRGADRSNPIYLHLLESANR